MPGEAWLGMNQQGTARLGGAAYDALLVAAHNSGMRPSAWVRNAVQKALDRDWSEHQATFADMADLLGTRMDLSYNVPAVIYERVRDAAVEKGMSMGVWVALACLMELKQ